MRILVTGGAGFIGTFTCDQLRKNGHEIIILDNLVTGSRKNVSSEDTLIIGDITDKKVYDTFTNEKIDVIIHLAAQTSVPESIIDPLNDQKQNIEGTLRILQAAKELGVKRVIFASSAAVYGNNEKIPIVETESLLPTSPYGISKMTCEKYIEVFCKSHNIDYIIFRFANVYGPKQTKDGEGGVIKIFIDKLLRDETPIIFGDGKQTRDFIFVEDIASAHVKGLSAPSGIYNLSSNTETTVNEIYTVISEGLNHIIKPSYAPPREGDIYRSCLSNKKAVELMGWSLNYSINSGLEFTIKATNRQI